MALLGGCALTAASAAAQAAAVAVCVGERIELSGLSWSAMDLASGMPVADPRTIAHADYVVTEHGDRTVTASLTPLRTENGTPRSQSMNFFFHRPGEYRVSAVDADGNSEQRDFSVAIPSATVARVANTGVNLYLFEGRPMLELGTLREAGLEFDIEIDMGSCGGIIADMQTLTFKDIEGLATNTIQRIDTGDESVLDYDPDIHATWHYSFRGPKEAGATLQQTYRDSPKFFPSDDVLCVSSEAAFRYYVIFRSARERSAWVPVAELDWQLEMYASRPGPQEPWIGGAGVHYGGQVRAPGRFSDTVTSWPSWSRSWTAVGTDEFPGRCSAHGAGGGSN